MQLLYNSYDGAHFCSPVAIVKCVPLQCPLSIQEGCPWPKRKPPETETQLLSEAIMFVGSFLLEASLTVKNPIPGPNAVPSYAAFVPSPITPKSSFHYFVCNTNFSCQQPTSQYVT